MSGFNVYPAEVEDVLERHPDVIEAGSRGRTAPSHRRGGQGVRGGATRIPTSTRRRCASTRLDHLARYKCPNKVMFVDELPRNAHGKLVRRLLDEACGIGLARAVS